MEINDVTFREGKRRDCMRLAELDHAASGGAVDFLFQGLIPNLTPVQIVAKNLESDQYPYTFRSAIVAEQKKEIIGAAISFPAEYHTISEEMIRFFPPERIEHFRDFFSNRVEGSYFLDALCVDSGYQSAGIGTRLIDLTKEKARKHGFNALSLIAFADNKAAIRLYERCGFKVEKHIELKPHELMPHQGGCLLFNCRMHV